MVEVTLKEHKAVIWGNAKKLKSLLNVIGWPSGSLDVWSLTVAERDILAQHLMDFQHSLNSLDAELKAVK